MGMISGAKAIAICLKKQKVKYVFGIVGVPVTPIAEELQKAGVRFIAMRNEQAASYAAQAASYLLGTPQGCLVVSGPGVTNAISGLANAKINKWPMFLIGGASPSYQSKMGAFQEEKQLESVAPFVKFYASIDSTERIPFFIEKAIRNSLFGEPGATYLDAPSDIIDGEVDEEIIDAMPELAEPPKSQASDEMIDKTIKLLQESKRPLIIIGKGMAWARAEKELRSLVDLLQMPFLPTPMGKGVVDDSHELNVSPARTLALREADVILLLGARLNWMLHFGKPPRFKDDVKIIQLDISAEDIGDNIPTEITLLGDGVNIIRQLTTKLEKEKISFKKQDAWFSQLEEKIASNKEQIDSMLSDNSEKMNYYHAFSVIKDLLPTDAIVVSEGANTMDIGRTQMLHSTPRKRLDAGTHGTMGVGLGFAIAAALAEPDKRVIAVEGDSAFGFSGMEVDTACRYDLPIIFIIFNNGGIGSGFDNKRDKKGEENVSALSHTAHYETMAEAFGGDGYFAQNMDEFRDALSTALSKSNTSVINVIIDPMADRKKQEFAWNRRDKMD
ncbi:MAG: thiamine pyrophosphate-binding protein [Dehalococcoidia bacterium]|nr:thiamine pyrophosphate-binding protein [Dehalococcoidia bacterium]